MKAILDEINARWPHLAAALAANTEAERAELRALWGGDMSQLIRENQECQALLGPPKGRA